MLLDDGISCPLEGDEKRVVRIEEAEYLVGIVGFSFRAEAYVEFKLLLVDSLFCFVISVADSIVPSTEVEVVELLYKLS